MVKSCFVEAVKRVRSPSGAHMIHESIALIQSVFSSYGAWGFFLLGIAEEVLFFIPSALLFLALGFFAISPSFTVSEAALYAFGPIAFAGAIGVTCGAFVMYVLAYYGGKPLIIRFGRCIGVKWYEIEQAHGFFSRGFADEIILIVLRALPIFPISVISLVCGVIRIRPLVFAITTFLGSFVRIGGLSLLGWYVEREFLLYAQKIAYFEELTLIAGVCVVFAFLYIHARKRRITLHRSE